MKILFDLQSLQTDSAKRGIGRYISGLLQALSQQAGVEVVAFLNGSLPFPINYELIKSMTCEVVCFYPPTNIDEGKNTNQGQMLYEQAELFYLNKVNEIKPDILFLGSLFKGAGQPFIIPPVEKIKKHCFVVAITYDFIPLEDIECYLPSMAHKICYKVSAIRQGCCDLLLCISDYVRNHAEILYPDVAKETIWGGVNSPFSDEVYSFEKRENYILYAGGVDPRKNVLQLLRAFALLPKKLQKKYPLKIVCSDNIQVYNAFKAETRNLGVSEYVDFVLKINDQGLADLYRKCRLFVFPSLCEGLGLPVLEAMASGAAVLTSRGTSLKEIYPKDEALFDPCSPEDLAAHIQAIIDDEKIKDLQQFSLQRAPIFTWKSVARECVNAIEEHYVQREKPKTMMQEEFIAQLSFYIGNDERVTRLCAKALARLYSETNSIEIPK